MKRIVTTFLLLLCASGIYAQSDKYKGFQYGLTFRAEIVDFISSQMSTNLSLGYRINKGNYVGLQSGFVFSGSTYLDANPSTHPYRGAPLLAEYTHYFHLGKSRKHAIYAGAEGGWIIARYYKGFGASWDSETQHQVYNTNPVTRTLPYVGVKGGLDFNIADVTHLQVGLIMSYPGYGISAGLTF